MKKIITDDHTSPIHIDKIQEIKNGNDSSGATSSGDSPGGSKLNFSSLRLALLESPGRRRIMDHSSSSPARTPTKNSPTSSKIEKNSPKGSRIEKNSPKGSRIEKNSPKGSRIEVLKNDSPKKIILKPQSPPSTPSHTSSMPRFVLPSSPPASGSTDAPRFATSPMRSARLSYFDNSVYEVAKKLPLTRICKKVNPILRKIFSCDLYGKLTSLVKICLSQPLHDNILSLFFLEKIKEVENQENESMIPLIPLYQARDRYKNNMSKNMKVMELDQILRDIDTLEKKIQKKYMGRLPFELVIIKTEKGYSYVIPQNRWFTQLMNESQVHHSNNLEEKMDKIFFEPEIKEPDHSEKSLLGNFLNMVGHSKVSAKKYDAKKEERDTYRANLCNRSDLTYIGYVLERGNRGTLGMLSSKIWEMFVREYETNILPVIFKTFDPNSSMKTDLPDYFFRFCLLYELSTLWSIGKDFFDTICYVADRFDENLKIINKMRYSDELQNPSENIWSPQNFKLFGPPEKNPPTIPPQGKDVSSPISIPQKNKETLIPTSSNKETLIPTSSNKETLIPADELLSLFSMLEKCVISLDGTYVEKEFIKKKGKDPQTPVPKKQMPTLTETVDKIIILLNILITHDLLQKKIPMSSLINLKLIGQTIASHLIEAIGIYDKHQGV